MPMKKRIEIKILLLKTNFYKMIFKICNSNIKIYNIDTIVYTLNKQPQLPLSIGKQINPHKPNTK